MPLTKLLEMTNEKVDAAQERVSNSFHPPPRSETDFCELVWENGHIMVQGQSTKARNGLLTANGYQSLVHNLQDGRDVNGLKTNKFSTMDCVLSDMGLAHDVDILPWLSYSAEDPLYNDYACDFLPELSGITRNDIPTDNNLAFGEKKSSSNAVKHSRGESSGAAQFLPKSGVSDITNDYVGHTHNVDSRDLNASSLCAFTRSRLQKLDARQPSTSASFTNFPYFSRSAALAKATHGVIVNSSKRLENDEQRCTVTSSIPTESFHAPVDDISQSLPRKHTEDLVSAKRTSREEDGTKNVEPSVAASSVGSGNSMDRASNERGYDLKRKSRETTESEGPSDEVEDESVGAKKAAHARASSKRSRAAEVHNLSERKRRDRINEKMRALQELIPNCNKVDKASMLDEAIDYLKTLQLQVQMLSMGAGLYMQPMMLPPGMQPMHGAQFPHFSPMGLGMGFGMNMPFQGPHYPAQFHGMPGPSLQPFGHLGQSLQTSMQQAPLTVPSSAPPSTPKDSDQQVRSSTIRSDYMNQATDNQATKEGIQPSLQSRDRKQNANVSDSLPPSTSNVA